MNELNTDTIKEYSLLSGFSETVKYKKNNTHDCKGLIFRGYTNEYYNAKTQKIEIKKTLSLLKRKSCICEKTLWMLDDLREDIGAIDIPKNIEYGKLYKLEVIDYCNGTYEYPDEGYVDLGFVEYNEEDKK